MLLLLHLLACAEPTMPEVEVVHAELQDIGLGNFTVVAGFVRGLGELEFVDVDGQVWRAPVSLWGPELGLSGGGGYPVTQHRDVVFADGEPASAPLELPAERMEAAQLLGRYRGLGAGGELGAGARVYWLRNRDDVSLRWVDVRLGVGFTVAYEWLELRLKESPELTDEVPDLSL
ncbi:MAG: hypothetical protein H6741_25460 [Alphaproteobacteria bacterium]|nr:hypothetical protein [Alphaproteobacteria bacterium]MCB9796059.1 hypothetical protein [Alphaproteobacteria bacterium]